MSFPRYEAYKESGIEWLGKVPAHWRCLPISAVATCNDEVLTEATPADFEIQYVEISDVEHGGGICASTTMLFADAPSRARRKVANGDVIVSTVRTYLKAIAQVKRPPSNLVVSTGFAVIRPQAIQSGYLGLLIASEYVIAEVISRSVGVSYPAINASEVMSIKIPMPPSKEQSVIAAFLDRETAKIDALVEEQRRLIALLEEKRQAVISHAVTKGLDPAAPMKHSGVEWLGEVPAHWRIVKLKHLFCLIKLQECANLPILSVYRDYGVIEKASRDDNINKTPEDLSLYQTVRQGDLVINKMKAWQGSLGISALNGITSPDYAVFSEKHSENCQFLNYLLRCRRLPSLFRSLSNGIRPDQWRIEPDKFLQLSVALPDTNEQRAIVERLDRETAKSSTLIAESQSAITLLQERRAALISAAVTGKIDVRGLAQAAEAA